MSKYLPVRRKLSNDEIDRLRQWMNDPTTKLALQVVASKQPAVMVPKTGPAEDIMQRESAKLNFIQGWQQCFNTFIGFLDEPGKPMDELVETYEQE